MLSLFTSTYSKLCDDIKTVMEFTYLGDSVSAGGGCEAAVTVRTRCGWFMFWECCELLYGRRISKAERGCL